MTYTEDFKCILAKQDNVVNANLFILRNSNPKKIKVFPEEVSSVLLEKYFETLSVATVYKGNIIKNLIMDCQSYTKYRPNETTGGIFVSWRRKEELPTGA